MGSLAKLPLTLTLSPEGRGNVGATSSHIALSPRWGEGRGEGLSGRKV